MEQNKTLLEAQLCDKWRAAKAKLEAATLEKHNIECELYELLKDEIPEKGTYSRKELGLKIVTGYAEKWDQEALTAIAKAWPQQFSVAFKPEYKCVKKNFDAMEQLSPDAWKALREALTLTPKKPAFSIEPLE